MAVPIFDLVGETEDDSLDDLKIVSTYEVLVSDPNTAQRDMKRSRPDLLRYNPHPRNSELRVPVWCDRWVSSPDDRDPCLFIVTAEYSHKRGGEGNDQLGQAKFEMRTPTWRTTYKQELIFKSPNDDRPFMNTAGDPIAGIQEERPFWLLSYSFAAKARPKWTKQYAGAINSDEVKLDGENFGKHQLLIGELEITPEFDEDANEYRRITMQVVVHPEDEGWIRQYPNVGYYEFLPTQMNPYVTGQKLTVARKAGRYRILDDKGEPIEKPAWLDQNGAAIRMPPDPNQQQTTRNQLQEKRPLKAPLDKTDFIWIKCDTRRKLPFKALKLK